MSFGRRYGRAGACGDQLEGVALIVDGARSCAGGAGPGVAVILSFESDPVALLELAGVERLHRLLPLLLHHLHHIAVVHHSRTRCGGNRPERSDERSCDER